MAALTITVANIQLAGAVQVRTVTAGEAITQGMIVTKNATTKKWVKGNHTAAELSGTTDVAFALTKAAADNDEILVATIGPINPGATLAKGTSYYLGQANGEIVPETDLGTGDYITRVGTATSTAILELDLRAFGQTKA